MRVYSGATFNMSDGEVGDDFRITNGGIANITGGTIGHEFWINPTSVVTLSNTTIVYYFYFLGSTPLTLSSGMTVDNGRWVLSGTTLIIDGANLGDKTTVRSSGTLQASGLAVRNRSFCPGP